MEEVCGMEEEISGGGFHAENGSCGRSACGQKEGEELMGGGLEEVLLAPAMEVGEGEVLDSGSCSVLDGGKDVQNSCGGGKEVLDEGLGYSQFLDNRGEVGCSRKSVLDWKQAVLGNGGDGAEMRQDQGCRFLEERKGSGTDDSAAQDRDVQKSVEGRGGTVPLASNKEGGEDVWQGRNCRGLVFHDKCEDYLEEDGITVAVDEIAASDCEVRLGRALVGKIFGRPVPFGFLNRELRRKWVKYGRIQMSLVGNNCFVCFFESEVVRDSVLRGGPWFVGNQLVGVDKWTAEFDPSSIKGFASPIWIRLPGLPLHYWSDSNLGRIASMIGAPLWVDEATSFWGRTEYARVCVKLDFQKKLPTGVWVKGGARKFFQPVVYEGIDQLCFKCGIVGHVEGDCVEGGKGVGHVGVQGGASSKEDWRNVGLQGMGVEMVEDPGQGKGDGGENVVAGGLGESVGQRSAGGHWNQAAVGNQGVKNAVTKDVVEECREDRGYGEWILVDRRKPHKIKFQQAPVSRAFKGGSGGAVKGGVGAGKFRKGGDVGEGVMKFAAVKDGGGSVDREGGKKGAGAVKVRKGGEVGESGMKFAAVKDGGGSVDKEGVKGEGKPLFVYVRSGGSSLSGGKSVGGKFRKKGGGVGGVRKLAADSGSVRGKVGGAEIFASRKEVAGSILLEGEGGSLLLEDEGGRKRRRGEERGVSGGDASPKVT